MKTGLNALVIALAYLAGFSNLTAGGAAFGGIVVTLRPEGFLFFHGKYKSSAAIKTTDRFFL